MESYLQKNYYLDLRSLAVFRVGLGLVILRSLWTLAPFLDAFYGANGLCPLSNPEIKKNLYYSLFALSDSRIFLVTVFSVFAFFALLLTFGLWTRVATAACLLLQLSLINRGPMYLNHSYIVIKCFLMWGLFLPLGARFSLDSRLRREAQPMPLRYVSAATVCLILQIAFIYISNGFEKSDALWSQEYTALHFALGSRAYGKPLATLLLPHYDLLRALCFLTLNMERYAFFLIALPFFPGLFRIFLIVAFTVFHIMIHLTMNVGWFSFAMIAGLSALVPSAVWDFFRKKKTLGDKYQKKYNALFLLLALVFLQTFTQSNRASFSKSKQPLPIKKMIASLGLRQRWNMFAPRPASISYTIYIYPIYQKVEGAAYPARMIPLESTKLRRCIKYLENLRNKKYRGLLYPKHLKAYLIREWNKKYPEEPVKDLEIIAREEYYQIKTMDYYFTGWVLL